MGTFLFVASFPYYTAIPEDVVVNTWHFQFIVGSPAEGNWSDANDRLATFYETIYSGFGLAAAPWLRPGLNTLKAYDVADPVPRSPVYEGSMALTIASPLTTSSMVPETAICLSYQADGESGESQARRRGRIYLGGLGGAITAGTTTSFPSVAGGQRATVADAAEALMNGMGSDGWAWVVYSRAGNSVAPVTNGWVDDEPDTQRRRGRRPTVRQLWP